MLINNKEKTSQLKKIPKENSKKLLPEGTCLQEQQQKIQSYRHLLSHPLYENLTLPHGTKFCQCIILKQNIQDQEPIFHMYFESSRKRLLSAQKQPNNIGCNYIISKIEKPKKDQNFVGKLRGNFRNNQFIVYDGGQNPKKKNMRKRKQLAFLQFKQQSIFNSQGQTVQILIPKPINTPDSTQKIPKYHPMDFIPQQQKQNLLLQTAKQDLSKILKLKKKVNSSISRGSITPSSIQSTFFDILNTKQQKFNLKLYEQNRNFIQVLSFCKRSQNTFSLLIGWPLNFIQAFGIILSVIERNSK